MKRTLLSAVLAILVCAGLSGQKATTSGIHPEDMDTGCKPCTDFWRYVNGAWLDKNPIPAHLRSWGPIQVMTETNQERTQTILNAAAADQDAKPGSDRRKMGDLYAGCMDTAAIDSRGLSPLQPDFDRIAKIGSLKDLGAVLAGFQTVPASSSFNSVVVAGPFLLLASLDAKQPSRRIASVVPAALSLPEREYYFKDDKKSQDIRAAFLQHVSRLLEIAGTAHSLAEEQSKIVLAFETELAESQMTAAERRDPEKTYHLTDLAGLRVLAPSFDWAQLLRKAGLPESTPIDVSEPELIKKFNRQLTAEPLDHWKTWLRWRELKINASLLAKPIADENFHFEQTVLAGIKEQRPRWQTCAGVVDANLGDALGKAWVEKYFPPEAKRRMTEMVENLRAAMRDELEHSDWMGPETRKAAIVKLNSLRVKVGYPDQWRDYSSLRIDRGAYFESVRAARAHEWQYLIGKIGKPVNLDDWGMTAPTVNAFSNPRKVEITFPAGFLQPPFFDLQADDAANYGAIGNVIGHEMGHQFDDGGSKFDATGALRNWWTEEDRKRFESRTGCVVEQFNTLDVGNGLHHNGRMVLGEAIGDLGGISVAYHAYQLSLKGKPGPVMDGFTADQRFFIAFARQLGSQIRPEAAVLQLNTNPHPLSQYRVIGTLQNVPAFHRAFQCKEGDAMVRPAGQQCKLW